MAQGNSPAGARRRVRLALREARPRLNQTQNDVAETMEWSLCKVRRIEKGDVTVAPNDLPPLLAWLGVRGKERVDDLAQAAEISGQCRDEPRFPDHVAAPLPQCVGHEAEAEGTFSSDAVALLAILQTRDHAPLGSVWPSTSRCSVGNSAIPSCAVSSWSRHSTWSTGVRCTCASRDVSRAAVGISNRRCLAKYHQQTSGRTRLPVERLL